MDIKIDITGMSPEDSVTASPQSDDSALARAAQYNPDAFAELYRRHLNRVYRYLLGRLGDVHQAQDLTAQTFLSAFENITSYHGQGKFISWLMTIARNKVADQFRARRVTLPLDAAAQAADPGPSPYQVTAARLRLEQVARAIPTLTPDRAEALTLRLFSGLSVGEVAQVMGKSEAAVKMLVHRAVCDLHERLAYGSEAEA
jgi:RNA polymerase sigma-70 factor (ECF subfamily)